MSCDAFGFAQLKIMPLKSKGELFLCDACVSGSCAVSKWPLVDDCSATEKLERVSSCSLLMRNYAFLFT